MLARLVLLKSTLPQVLVPPVVCQHIEQGIADAGGDITSALPPSGHDAGNTRIDDKFLGSHNIHKADGDSDHKSGIDPFFINELT